MSANGSGLTSGNANAPQGAQVGYIMNNGSMSYSVYLDADTYSLSFLAAQRVKYQTQSQQIQVLVDGAASRVGYALRHDVHSLPDVEFHGRGRNAHHPVRRSDESAQRPTAPPSSTRWPSRRRKTRSATAVSRRRSWPRTATQIAPGGSGWQFSGVAGISTNGSAFTGQQGTPMPPTGPRCLHQGQRQHEPVRLL